MFSVRMTCCRRTTSLLSDVRAVTRDSVITLQTQSETCVFRTTSVLSDVCEVRARAKSRVLCTKCTISPLFTLFAHDLRAVGRVRGYARGEKHRALFPKSALFLLFCRHVFSAQYPSIPSCRTSRSDTHGVFFAREKHTKTHKKHRKTHRVFLFVCHHT